MVSGNSPSRVDRQPDAGIKFCLGSSFFRHTLQADRWRWLESSRVCASVVRRVVSRRRIFCWRAYNGTIHRARAFRREARRAPSFKWISGVDPFRS